LPSGTRDFFPSVGFPPAGVPAFEETFGGDGLVGDREPPPPGDSL